VESKRKQVFPVVKKILVKGKEGETKIKKGLGTDQQVKNMPIPGKRGGKKNYFITREHGYEGIGVTKTSRSKTSMREEASFQRAARFAKEEKPIRHGGKRNVGESLARYGTMEAQKPHCPLQFCEKTYICGGNAKCFLTGGE